MTRIGSQNSSSASVANTANAHGVAIRIGVLVIGRKRPGFDQEWNGVIRARALSALVTLGYDCVGADARVVDDQTIESALNAVRQSGAEALVILQPSLGNGQLSMTVAQQWDAPVVLWATPERQDSQAVSSCSLVAQHLWASNFRQAKFPFELVNGDPQDPATQQSLKQAIALCRTVARLRRAKLGLIGSHAPGYIAMVPSAFALRREIGTQLQSLSLPQYIDRARSIDELAVRDDVERVRAMQLPMNDVQDADLATNSRYYLAMKELIDEERLDALAIQCWPELPNVMGQWPYLAIARLADEGFAVSMEGDADGALICLAANLLGAGAGFITDWLEHNENVIHFWHAGTAPISMCNPIGSDRGPTLARHFNIAKPLVVDGELRVGEPVTIARMWRCDDRYHLTAFQGRTIPPRRKLTGNSATVEIEGGNVANLFDTLCHAGMPHHPVLFYGRHADIFRRVARMLDINWVFLRGMGVSPMHC